MLLSINNIDNSMFGENEEQLRYCGARSVKVSEEHSLGYHVEKIAYCNDGRDPIINMDGSLATEVIVEPGIMRSLFLLFLFQWMIFGSLAISVIFDSHKGIINLFVSLLCLSLVSLSRRLFSRKISQVDMLTNK